MVSALAPVYTTVPSRIVQNPRQSRSRSLLQKTFDRRAFGLPGPSITYSTLMTSLFEQRIINNSNYGNRGGGNNRYSTNQSNQPSRGKKPRSLSIEDLHPRSTSSGQSERTYRTLGGDDYGEEGYGSAAAAYDPSMWEEDEEIFGAYEGPKHRQQDRTRSTGSDSDAAEVAKQSSTGQETNVKAESANLKVDEKEKEDDTSTVLNLGDNDDGGSGFGKDAREEESGWRE